MAGKKPDHTGNIRCHAGSNPGFSCVFRRYEHGNPESAHIFFGVQSIAQFFDDAFWLVVFGSSMQHCSC